MTETDYSPGAFLTPFALPTPETKEEFADALSGGLAELYSLVTYESDHLDGMGPGINSRAIHASAARLGYLFEYGAIRHPVTYEGHRIGRIALLNLSDLVDKGELCLLEPRGRILLPWYVALHEVRDVNDLLGRFSVDGRPVPLVETDVG